MLCSRRTCRTPSVDGVPLRIIVERPTRLFPERHRGPRDDYHTMDAIVGAPPLFFPPCAGPRGPPAPLHGRHTLLLLGGVVAAAPRSMGACSPSDGCPRASRELCCCRCDRMRALFQVALGQQHENLNVRGTPSSARHLKTHNLTPDT